MPAKSEKGLDLPRRVPGNISSRILRAGLARSWGIAFPVWALICGLLLPLAVVEAVLTTAWRRGRAMVLWVVAMAVTALTTLKNGVTFPFRAAVRAARWTARAIIAALLRAYGSLKSLLYSALVTPAKKDF